MFDFPASPTLGQPFTPVSGGAVGGAGAILLKEYF